MSLMDHTGQDPPSQSEDSGPVSAPRRIWMWRVATLTIVGLLLLRAWRSHAGSNDHAGLTIQNSSDLAWWLSGIAYRQLVLFVLFLMLGALVPVAWTTASDSATSPRK